MADVDLWPFVKDLCIVDKSAKVSRLEDVIVWPQKLMIDWTSRNLSQGKPTRAIILKARQLGISTILRAIDFTFAMEVDHYRSQTISHTSKSNAHLISMSQVYFDHFRFQRMYEQTNKAATHLGWDPVKSSMGVNTAKTLQGLRSLTVLFAHASEVAFWPNATTLMASVGPAIPKTPFSFLYLESTANGIGNWFAETWDNAVSGDNDFTPFFFAWQSHPQYTGDYIGIDPIDPRSMDEREALLAEQFAADRLGEENQLVLSRTMTRDQLDAISGPMSKAEIASRLAWRRYIIRNELKDPDLFLQEYPHRPSVAFLSTGRNMFPLPTLEPAYVPARALVGDLMSIGGRIQFKEQPFGSLKVYKPPHPDRHYIIGADPTFSSEGDYAVAQVLDRQTFEQVAVYRHRIHPGPFATEIARLGYWYNEALIAPESNKDGATTVGHLSGVGYLRIWQRRVVDTLGQGTTNKMGWHTNSQTKHEALGNLQAAIYDGSLMIHDEHTFTELKNYVALDGGRFGNANGSQNDDTVMSLAIAVTANNYEAHELPADSRDTESMYREQAELMGKMQAWLSDSKSDRPYDGGGDYEGSDW